MKFLCYTKICVRAFCRLNISFVMSFRGCFEVSGSTNLYDNTCKTALAHYRAFN